MRILLMRHAAAVDGGPDLPDEQRFLSGTGRETARRVGARLEQEGVDVQAIHTSPLVRAVQTAELLAAALGYSGEVRSLSSLAPGYPPRLVADALDPSAGTVLLVGHEPGISALAALLIARPGFPPFRPAQVTLLERGAVSWALNPTTLELDHVLVA
ncbi:MAG TPA: phosphohistidine phosphatase SixA [Polyangiaceae bacterium]|nr:phosphohistidine phosphatase SixA [Polyangiaceae bacterium]